jgi:hypothetical protein
VGDYSLNWREQQLNFGQLGRIFNREQEAYRFAQFTIETDKPVPKGGWYHHSNNQRFHYVSEFRFVAPPIGAAVSQLDYSPYEEAIERMTTYLKCLALDLGATSTIWRLQPCCMGAVCLAICAFVRDREEQ